MFDCHYKSHDTCFYSNLACYGYLFVNLPITLFLTLSFNVKFFFINSEKERRQSQIYYLILK